MLVLLPSFTLILVNDVILWVIHTATSSTMEWKPWGPVLGMICLVLGDTVQGNIVDHRHNRNSLSDECGKRIYVEVVSANSRIQKQQVIPYTPHEKEIKY